MNLGFYFKSKDVTYVTNDIKQFCEDHPNCERINGPNADVEFYYSERIDETMDQIQAQELKVIGLYGRGNAGKTNLAKVLAHKLGADYINVDKEVRRGYSLSTEQKEKMLKSLEEASKIIIIDSVFLLKIFEDIGFDKTKSFLIFVCGGKFPDAYDLKDESCAVTIIHKYYETIDPENETDYVYTR